MPNKQDWEEEFDKSISIQFNCGEPYWPDWEAVKDFIKSLLSKREAEIRKETILAVLPEADDIYIFENGETFDAGFIKCRQSIIDSAQEKYGIKL